MNINKISCVGLVCLSMACVQNASASDNMFSEYAITGELSSRGLGLNATTNLTSQLNGRLSLAGFTYSADQDLDDVSYETDLTLMTAGGLVDWHPFSGGFRLTTGLFLNFNGLEGSVTPTSTETIDINNTSYSSTELGKLDVEVEYNVVSPYVGIGWGNPVAKDSNWTFFSDLGILYTGKPSVSLSATPNSSLSATDIATLNANVAAAQQDIEDEDYLKYLQYYPVFSLGLSYRF
ncbi:MAG: hypothetical protein HQL69_14765 [Magnetococcales bacterium]|nr:hypothetical protein [Magnetococcales bacterium]